MKKMMFVVAVVLMGCNGPFYTNEMGYEELSLSPDEAWAAMSDFVYIEEYGEFDYIKSPREFERDGGGDCDDFAVYMCYLLGPESYTIWATDGERKHVFIEYKGEWLEPQITGMRWAKNRWEVLYRRGYYTTMEMATHDGTRRITW